MIRAEGATFNELESHVVGFKAAMQRAAAKVMEHVATELGAFRVAAATPEEEQQNRIVSLDGLATITDLWMSEVDNELMPLIATIYLHGAHSLGKTAKDARKIIEPVTDVDLMTSSLAAAILQDAKNRISSFSDELWNTAKSQLVEGIINGESVDDLRDRLRSVVELCEPRAETIARTEVISASNSGSLALVQTAGFSGDKIWFSTPDDRTRESHRLAEGQTVPIGSPFIVGGVPMQYPGDPTGPAAETINCRCTMGYSLHPQEALIASGDAMSVPCEWIGVLTLEGSPTGDARMFAPDSLTWEDLPLPLMWQKETSDGHDNSVIVGNITNIGRQGNMIIGRGTFDMGGEDGQEAYRIVKQGYLQGISIDADNVLPSNVEYQYGPGMDENGGAAISMTIIHAARIRAATLCAIPAFIEAKISIVPSPAGSDNTDEPDDEPDDQENKDNNNDENDDGNDDQAEDAPEGPEWIPVMRPKTPPSAYPAAFTALVAAGVPVHHTATTDAAWDGQAATDRLDSPMKLAKAKNVFAWYDSSEVKNGEIDKTKCKLPHHEVSADGKPGAANMSACSAGIAVLHGARGGIDIPDADRKVAYNHLAAHLRDGGEKIPPYSPKPFTSHTMTAAAYTLTIPEVPKKEWFDEPTDVEMYGALTVTDEGRIYGYLAPAGVAHRSYTQRVTVPMGNIDYSEFMSRETIVEGGRLITGALTMDCGHASTEYADARIALDHYDNACSVVASVRIGENRQGVWIAGSLIPGITANQLTRMMNCTLSGDWRPHRGRNGWREFTGALLVPVPGFSMARTAPSVTVEEGQLVASSIPIMYEPSLQACTTAIFDPEPEVDFANTVNVIAKSVGLDLPSRIGKLAASINQGRQ